MDIQETEILVEIEYISSGKSKADKYIFVRKLENRDFMLTPESEIEGCPIKEFGLPPRTEKKYIVTLILKTRLDLSRFFVGQIATIRKVKHCLL